MALWGCCAVHVKVLTSSNILFVSLQKTIRFVIAPALLNERAFFLSLTVTVPPQRATEGSIQALICICKSAHVRAEMQH